MPQEINYSSLRRKLRALGQTYLHALKRNNASVDVEYNGKTYHLNASRSHGTYRGIFCLDSCECYSIIQPFFVSPSNMTIDVLILFACIATKLVTIMVEEGIPNGLPDPV